MSDIVNISIEETIEEVNISIVDGGDMVRSVYDPANGARQVAFADELDPSKWEADGDETIKPIPLEDLTPVKVKAEHITVGTAPIPNSDKVALNDSLQDVVGKVLGLQEGERVLIDHTLTVAAHTLEYTLDDEGNALDITGKLNIYIYIPEFETALGGGGQSSRFYARFNDVAASVYERGSTTTSTYIFFLPTNSAKQFSGLNIFVNNGYIGKSNGNTTLYSQASIYDFQSITKILLTSVDSNSLAVIGSRIIITTR